VGAMMGLVRYWVWSYRAVYIAVLAGLGMWLLGPFGLLAGAGAPWEKDWPRTDFSRRTVEPGEITSGGPPKDGIPAIDRPRFVTPAEAEAWLGAQEPVIVLEGGAAGRAYPLQILIWHEIVNDELEGLPVAVTFCPLCNAAMVFDRRVDGRVLDFGTTGKLRKSDMVMYDRQTESWWQQFTGMGIVGAYTGVELRRIPGKIVAFDEFRRAYPHGQVLARHTGYRRSYGTNPYRGYDRIGDQPFLLDDPADPRLPAMERVVGVTAGDRTRIYPFSRLKGAGVLQDELGGVPIAIFHRRNLRSVLDKARIKDSRLIQAATVYDRRLGNRRLDFAVLDGRLTDRQTGSEWDLLGRAVAGPLNGRRLEAVGSGVHFAFAWLAFNPDSEIYGH